MQTSAPITFLTLLRKYNGRIMQAHELEMQAAARAVPAGKNKHEALMDARHNYTQESVMKAVKEGHRLCFNRQGLCEPDKCNCR